MDIRLLLLMHVPMGLRLESSDVARLLALETDPFSSESVLSALRSQAARIYMSENKDWFERSLKILQLSNHHGIRWTYVGQADYPTCWLDLVEWPVVFSYQGEPCWQTTPLLAVVGSRTPMTDTLRWMQRELGEFLRLKKVGVVSGGARGIDQWAHRISLDAKQPTACILPSGLLNPYPFHCEDLWRRILQSGGCLISSCALQEPLSKSFFYRRNRWIVGLSPGCFVAEANRRSGSLLTAKLCQEEHRDICTLPLFPTSTQGLGNLDLLEKGAILLRDHRDLATFWDALCPGTFQTTQCKEQE